MGKAIRGVWFLLVLSGQAIHTVFAAGPCDAALNDGLRNEFNISITGNIQQDVRTALCKDFRSNAGRRTRASLDTVIQGAPVIGRYSSEKKTQIAEQICEEGEQSLNEHQALTIAQRIVPAEAYTSWTSCMLRQSAGAAGLTIDIEQAGKEAATITLRWVPTYPIQRLMTLPKFSNPSVTVLGGGCRDPFPPGREVLPSQSMICERQIGSVFQVIVQTDYASIATELLPSSAPKNEICTGELRADEPRTCYAKEIQKSIVGCLYLRQQGVNDQRSAAVLRNCQQRITNAKDLLAAWDSLTHARERCAANCNQDPVYKEVLDRFIGIRAAYQGTDFYQ